LAQRAFSTTAAYDGAISAALAKINLKGDQFDLGTLLQTGTAFPQNMRFSLDKVMDLRYGENPHQKAAMYSDGSGAGVANGRQLQGKELSYNNIVDLQAAWDLAQEFEEIACAIIKHSNPCGTATGSSLRQAYQRALEADPVSAFGGVIGVNRTVDEEAAEEIANCLLKPSQRPVSMRLPWLDSPPRKTCGWLKCAPARRDSPPNMFPEGCWCKMWTIVP
jgi:phosphoribosylaminoimidazolecarboxamide formyltransferase/IMP cyclohydrolase